jgi:Pyrimidine dimer DNA glycosylase
VQTYLPYPDFAASARVLDPRRLGRQRGEALQILQALTTAGSGWRHHPAVQMWRGYPEALGSYGMTMCRAWFVLGFADTCELKLREELAHVGVAAPRSQRELAEAGALPQWLGDPALHLSHQSNLVRKDPAFYKERFPDVPDDLPYVWPLRSASRSS